MAMMFQQPIMQALDGAGVAVPGAKLFFYEQGTTTFLDVFQDEGLTIPHTNPVITSNGARFPAIWLQEAAYTVRYTIPVNNIDEQVWSVDITGITLPAASESQAGIVRLATPAEMADGLLTTVVPSVNNVTNNIVLNAGRIQSGTLNAARLPAATDAVQGAVILADATAITDGTPGRVVDAAQLKAAIDGLGGGILIRIQPNNVETGQTPTGTRWIGDDATAPLRPSGGIASDVHAVGGGNENRIDQIRYALIEYSIDGGDNWVEALDA